LHSGTSISEAASALISRSLTESLIPRLSSPALSSRAQLEKRVELDVDGEIDVRDRLLRLGQAAGDRLAHVGQLDDFVRDFCPERSTGRRPAVAEQPLRLACRAFSRSALTIRPPGPLP
jgi:hypothetical protein